MEVLVVVKYGKTRLNITQAVGAEWRFPEFMLYEDKVK